MFGFGPDQVNLKGRALCRHKVHRESLANKVAQILSLTSLLSIRQKHQPLELKLRNQFVESALKLFRKKKQSPWFMYVRANLEQISLDRKMPFDKFMGNLFAKTVKQIIETFKKEDILKENVEKAVSESRDLMESLARDLSVEDPSIFQDLIEKKSVQKKEGLYNEYQETMRNFKMLFVSLRLRLRSAQKTVNTRFQKNIQILLQKKINNVIFDAYFKSQYNRKMAVFSKDRGIDLKTIYDILVVEGIVNPLSRAWSPIIYCPFDINRPKKKRVII